MKLPPLNTDYDDVYLVLNFTTLYHISRPKHGPHSGDPSHGWLFRALEVNPNRYSLLPPLFPENLQFPRGTVPNCLNLLDFRVSELCKCYTLKFCGAPRPEGDVLYKLAIDDKVIVLSDDHEFIVVALFPDSCMSYWKFRDKEWTSIDSSSRKYGITDLLFFKGKIYAVGRVGVLVSFDSEFNLTEIHFPSLPQVCVNRDNFLVEYKADLYVITKILDNPGYVEDEDEGYGNEVPLRLGIFKKNCSNWEPIGCLGDGIFISSANFSIGLSVEDFKGFKGNRVFYAHYDSSFADFNDTVLYGVYDLDENRRMSTMIRHQDCTLLYWPPPRWLMTC